MASSVSQASHLQLFLNTVKVGEAFCTDQNWQLCELFLCAIILTGQCFNILLVYSEMQECISLSAAATTLHV